MILQNPKTDIQSLFIGRVQYIQSHAIYVIWLGYGILFIMASLESLVKNNPITKVIGVTLVLLLPFSLIYKNYNNQAQLKVVGGAEQNGHDFGWQFGNWQLQGVDGIKEDLQYWYSPEEFQAQWDAYPDKTYPPPMGTNAIFFGGTDPGRFVPTYMIYSAKVRPDVYLITQNALADGTYMNVMRDLYGDQIWIPTPTDNNQAFNMYIEGVKSGRINAGADVSTVGGKLQVHGVGGVMQINGILSRMIFDHNQYVTETTNDEATRPTGSAAVYQDPVIDPKSGNPPQRSFYVEESYVLPWMYPYLTPHGLIMKINNKPTPLTADIIKKDTDFWNWYTDRLLNDERFIRDIVARKSFCKLRSAIAGLYDARGKRKESEAAFRQAIALYDLSPEANYRLANLLAKQGRIDEAIAQMKGFIEKDPKSTSGKSFLAQLENRYTQQMRMRQLEQKIATQAMAAEEVAELISIYYGFKLTRQGDALAMQLIDSGELPPQQLIQFAQTMAQAKRLKVVEHALKKYTEISPRDPQGWINLAALQLAINKRSEMLASLKTAVDLGGELSRNVIRKDPRFEPARTMTEFQKLIPPPTAAGNMTPLPKM